MAPEESVQVLQGSRAPERLHKKFGPYFRSNRESLRGSKPDTDIIISALFQRHSSVRRRKERREEKRKAGITTGDEGGVGQGGGDGKGDRKKLRSKIYFRSRINHAHEGIGCQWYH